MYSIRIELDKVIENKEYTQLVFENLKHCKRTVGLRFKVILWHNNLDKKIIKDFTIDNKEILFDLNAQITAKNTKSWFLVKSSKEEISDARYRYEGNVLDGIVEYLKIIKHMLRRDGQ